MHVAVDGSRHQNRDHGSQRFALAAEVVRSYRVEFVLVRVPSQLLRQATEQLTVTPIAE